MVYPCCDLPLQTSVNCLAVYDMVWIFIRSIYHLNELLTTFDSWVAAGSIPENGSISASFDGFFVILYITYFGLSILLIAGAHSQNPTKLNAWVILTCLVITIQALVFQGSIIYGLVHPKLQAGESIIPDSFYFENNMRFRILKIPLQAFCFGGIFYTLYEIWVVKLYIEEIVEAAAECLNELQSYQHNHCAPIRSSPT